MTLGELIARAVSDAAFKNGHDGMNAGAHAASQEWGRCMRVVRNVLLSRGLWDAEVLETVVQPVEGIEGAGGVVCALIDQEHIGEERP